MMRKIQQIWEDIRQGENIDKYLTVVLAIVLPVLSLFGIAQSWVASLTLVSLGLFACTMLGNRHRMERVERMMESLIKRLGSSTNPPLQIRTDLPPLRDTAKDAKDILIIGRTALQVLRDTEFFKDKIDQGASIRLAVVNPDNNAVIEAIAQAVEIDVEGLINDMGSATSLVRCIREQTRNPTQFQVRVFDYVPTLSLVMVDGRHLPNGHIIVEMTPYKTNPTSRPHLFITAKDHPVWHAYFCDRCEAIWRDAEPSSAHTN